MYDHAKHVVNNWDIFKHNVLLSTIKVSPIKTYFESHCGHPYYSTNAGVWRSSWMRVAHIYYPKINIEKYKYDPHEVLNILKRNIEKGIMITEKVVKSYKSDLNA